MNDILSKIAVSLLVRLRVEISPQGLNVQSPMVSLLVRLRVEMIQYTSIYHQEHCQPPREAAS